MVEHYYKHKMLWTKHYQAGEQDWVILAQSYLLNGENEEACDVLTTGSRFEPQNWEIMRNLLDVSLECGYHRIAVRSYLKLLQLRPDYLNLELLNRIIDEIYGEENENVYPKEMKLELREKVMAIFEKHTDVHPKYPPVWCCYGLAIATSHRNPDTEFREIIIKTLFMAIKVLMEDRNWFLNENQVKYVLKGGKYIACVFAACSDILPGTTEGHKLLVVAKEFLIKISDKVEEHQRNISNTGVDQKFANDYFAVKRSINLIDEKLNAPEKPCEEIWLSKLEQNK